MNNDSNDKKKKNVGKKGSDNIIIVQMYQLALVLTIIMKLTAQTITIMRMIH